MNNLDVSKFAVQELNSKEMLEIEGGKLFSARGLFSWMFGDSSWDDVEITLFGLQIK